MCVNKVPSSGQLSLKTQDVESQNSKRNNKLLHKRHKGAY